MTDEKKLKRAVYQAEYRRKNAEQIKEHTRKWHQENAERNKQRKREYYLANRQKFIDAQKERYRKNPQAVKDRAAEWAKNNPSEIKKIRKRWASSNRDKTRAACQRHRKSNPEKAKARLAKWRSENKDKIRAYEIATASIRRERARQRREEHPEVRLKARVSASKRRAAKAANGGAFDETHILSLLKKQKCKCVGCEADISAGYEIDHVMPLALGGSNGPENLQLLCRFCNRSKGAKHPDIWAAERGQLFA